VDLDEVVAVAGGAAEEAEVERALTPAGRDGFFAARDAVGAAIAAVVRMTALDNVFHVVTRSTSMHCGARRLNGGDAAILIPLGVLARTRVLARLLRCYTDRRYAGREPVINMMGSAMDERTYPFEIAPDLVPLFGEHDGGDESYYNALEALDRRTPPDPYRDAFAIDVMGMCLTYLTLHELTHLTARHDTLSKLDRAADPRIPAHLSGVPLRRGSEVHADVTAANHTMMLSLLGLEDIQPNRARKRRLHELLYRLPFAATMLFGMYDAHRKTVYDYDEGPYPHPIIRYEIWNAWSHAAVESIRPSTAKTAAKLGDAGFWDCIVAYNAMEFDCMTGQYGGTPQDTGRYFPLTALKYGAASALQSRIEADDLLWQQVAALVPMAEAESR
jgi:hypothetical protein